MLTSDRIMPRPAERLPLAEASRLSRIEEIGARLAEIRRQINALDGAHYEVEQMPESLLDTIDYSPTHYIEDAQKRLWNEKCILEQMLSVSKPESLRDVMIMTACVCWRLDTIRDLGPDTGNCRCSFNVDFGIIENTIIGTLPALEALAGVTLKELGLDDYWSPDKTTIELAEGVAALNATMPSQEGGAAA